MARLTDEQLQRSKPILSIAKPPRGRHDRGVWYDVFLNTGVVLVCLCALTVLTIALVGLIWVAARIIDHI